MNFSLPTLIQYFFSILSQLQSDSCHLGEAVEVWLSLLSAPELAPHHAAIQKRFNQAMTPHHFLAHMTHPLYLGE